MTDEQREQILEELRVTDQIAINRITNSMAAFAEQHHAALLALPALGSALWDAARRRGGTLTVLAQRT